MAPVGLMKVALACFCALVVFHGQTTTATQPNPNTITLRFVNNLSTPMFDFSIDVTVNRAKTILELMEEAAWQDTTFKYSMEYHASVPGYMVNAVRKDEVQGNDYVRNPFAFGDVNWDGNHSYWRIQIDGTSIPVGISIYQPKKGDTVTFELVIYQA